MVIQYQSGTYRLDITDVQLVQADVRVIATMFPLHSGALIESAIASGPDPLLYSSTSLSLTSRIPAYVILQARVVSSIV